MAYLFSQFWIFIALAIFLGMYVGWSTHDASATHHNHSHHGLSDHGYDGHRDVNKNWLSWAVVLFLAGLFVALFKWIPGFWGLALEVALMLFGAYITGCGMGCAGSEKTHMHDGHSISES